MYTKKREPRVGHRTNQASHQFSPRGNNVVILSAEGNYSYRWFLAGQSADPIAVKAGTVDDKSSLNTVGTRFDYSGATSSVELSHFAARPDLAALLLDDFSILPAYLDVVSNPGRRNMQPGYSTRMGLDLANFLAP